MKKDNKKTIEIVKQLVEALDAAENVADICDAYERDVDKELKEIARAKRAGRKFLKEFSTKSPDKDINELEKKITKIIYQNSHDDSECLRIRFENIQKVIGLLVECANLHKCKK